MQPYRPEGPIQSIPSSEALHLGVGTKEIFQARCIKCDEYHNLHVDLGPIRGLIPREEAALGIAEGTTKEIAILSRVGKTVSFQVKSFDPQGNAILSRRSAQLDARSHFLSALHPGDIINAMVLNPADFGVFCDIGCGFPALMRIDRCCISRLQNTAELFHPGQEIYAAVLSTDDVAKKISLTGRELLGTWEENAALFSPGQTVTGVVRSVMDYGAFIELTPNLSGLTENEVPLSVGDRVSVYIRSILPEKHKIKLNVLEVLSSLPQPSLTFFKNSNHLDRWEYYPGSRNVTYF